MLVLVVVCPFNLVVVCPTNLSLDIIELPGLIIYIASCLEVFENCLITYLKCCPVAMMSCLYSLMKNRL